MTVNGDAVEASVEPRTQLAEFLRQELQLTGTHLACEHGVCGACTVLIDGKPARSCITYAVACEGAEVTTVEGFRDDEVMGALRKAFAKHHGLQCGFCTPGMLTTARDIVVRLPDADEGRIRRELAGNLCRCTGYMGIVAAISEVIAGRREGGAAAPEAPTASPPLESFEATDTGRQGEQARAGPESEDGWISVTERFDVPYPPDVVWELLSDAERVAPCIPGAAIEGREGNHIRASAWPTTSCASWRRSSRGTYPASCRASRRSRASSAPSAFSSPRSAGGSAGSSVATTKPDPSRRSALPAARIGKRRRAAEPEDVPEPPRRPRCPTPG